MDASDCDVASTHWSHWHGIPWRDAHQEFGRLQQCGQRITKESGWHIHHVTRRSEGGTDATSNLPLLHPNCHRQHHASKSLDYL